MTNQNTVGAYSNIVDALARAIGLAGGPTNILRITITTKDEGLCIIDEDNMVEEVEEDEGPEDEDEEDPEELETMCFARAFVAMRNGLTMARLRWDHDNRIRVQTECKGHECTMPFLVNTNGFDAVPWTPSQDDLFADDWYIYK